MLISKERTAWSEERQPEQGYTSQDPLPFAPYFLHRPQFATLLFATTHNKLTFIPDQQVTYSHTHTLTPYRHDEKSKLSLWL